MKRSPGTSECWLGGVLWKHSGVDLAVVINEVDLQAIGDVVRQVREVLPVLRWQDHAGHTSSTCLTNKRGSRLNSGE